MDAILQAHVSQVEAANHVGADGLHLVGLAPAGGGLGSGRGSVRGMVLPALTACRVGAQLMKQSTALGARSLAAGGAGGAAAENPGRARSAPVHVGAAGHARRVEHVGGLHLRAGTKAWAAEGAARVADHFRPGALGGGYAWHSVQGSRSKPNNWRHPAPALPEAQHPAPTRSMSARMAARSSRRAVPYSNLAPCFFSSSPTRPPAGRAAVQHWSAPGRQGQRESRTGGAERICRTAHAAAAGLTNPAAAAIDQEGLRGRGGCAAGQGRLTGGGGSTSGGGSNRVGPPRPRWLGWRPARGDAAPWIHPYASGRQAGALGPLPQGH